MELILMVALFFIIMKLVVQEPSKPKIQCNIHKWVYKDAGDGNEYMICATCNKRPGDGLDDGSEI